MDKDPDVRLEALFVLGDTMAKNQVSNTIGLNLGQVDTILNLGQVLNLCQVTIAQKQVSDTVRSVMPLV